MDTIYAVRQGPLKLVIERGGSGLPPALYNLADDIREKHDLALTQPNDVAALKALYDEWTSVTVPPLWQAASEFPVTLVLAGDWNGYNIKRLGPPWQLTRVTAPGQERTPDGFNWFTSTIHVATTGGDTTPGVHQFALAANEQYSTQWGGATIAIDDATAVPYDSGSSLGPTSTVSFDDGFYYSFRILDPLKQLNTSLNVAVMKTSAPPISVSRTAQVPVIPLPGDAITVNITTSEAKSAEERIYLRWTTDGFITSNMIAAAGSDKSYTATIPGQPAGAFVQYSILTSTTDLAPFFASGVIDSHTLASTATFNAEDKAPPTPTPTPTPPPPTITVQPIDKTVTEERRRSSPLARPALFRCVINGRRMELLFSMAPGQDIRRLQQHSQTTASFTP